MTIEPFLLACLFMEPKLGNKGISTLHILQMTFLKEGMWQPLCHVFVNPDWGCMLASAGVPLLPSQTPGWCGHFLSSFLISSYRNQGTTSHHFLCLFWEEIMTRASQELVDTWLFCQGRVLVRDSVTAINFAEFVTTLGLHSFSTWPPYHCGHNILAYNKSNVFLL